MKCDEIYVSTHSNRFFLYNWVNELNLFPVSDYLTRDEFGQTRAIHGSIKQKDLQILTKDFKTFITSKHECKSKDIECYNLSYITSAFQVPFYNKIFESLPSDIEIDDSLKNRIVFIPQKRMGESVADAILEKLIDLKADPLIVGDIKTYFPEQNVLLKTTDYFHMVYEKLRKIILESKCLICPNGYLATIANLDGKNVFTWGTSPGQYKLDGIYNFGNRNSMSISFERTSPINGLTKTMEYFMKRRKII